MKRLEIGVFFDDQPCPWGETMIDRLANERQFKEDRLWCELGGGGKRWFRGALGGADAEELDVTGLSGGGLIDAHERRLDGGDFSREFAGELRSQAPFDLSYAGFDVVEPFDQRFEIRRLASAGIGTAAVERGAEADNESGASGDGDSAKKCSGHG
jgi:hypothetical protein